MYLSSVNVAVVSAFSIPSLMPIMPGTCLLPRGACRHDLGLCRCNYRINFDSAIGGMIGLLASFAWNSLRLSCRPSPTGRGECAVSRAGPCTASHMDTTMMSFPDGWMYKCAWSPYVVTTGCQSACTCLPCLMPSPASPANSLLLCTVWNFLITFSLINLFMSPVLGALSSE